MITAPMAKNTRMIETMTCSMAMPIAFKNPTLKKLMTKINHKNNPRMIVKKMPRKTVIEGKTNRLINFIKSEKRSAFRKFAFPPTILTANQRVKPEIKISTRAPIKNGIDKGKFIGIWDIILV